MVDGEGEFAFQEIIHIACGAVPGKSYKSIQGISYRDALGLAITTPERARIENLDIIPSPFLGGALAFEQGATWFPYDYALMETNRGCPYKCSFCYWGGAIGQRVRSFSRDRLREELEFLAFHKAETVFLCDANFGMLEADEEFVEDIIRTREQYGFPRALEANWAKNKSSRFRGIVRALKHAGLKSSFTVALQTLTEEALVEMQRHNMKINQWEDLVDWLTDEGLECFAEMIWGAPGDTPQTFLDGYDRLAERINRIAVYPLLLLPNTAYSEARDQHGFVTLRGQDDDFEYVLASRTSNLAEHLRMQRFMYMARIAGENQYLRYLWLPARRLAQLSQSAMILDLIQWLEDSLDPAVTRFLHEWPVIAESPAVAWGHRQMYENPELDKAIEQWWRDRIVPRFPDAWREFGRWLYEFQRRMRPVYESPETGYPKDLQLIGDEFVAGPVEFPLAIVRDLERLPHDLSNPSPQRTIYEFRSARGFYNHLDNHEVGAHYFARAIQLQGAN